MDKDINTAHSSESDKMDRTVGEAHAPKPERGSRIFFRLCAVVGLLCAMAGWLLFYGYPSQAVTMGCIGVCTSVAGLWSGCRWLRSVAVTGIIVAGVLLLVYFAFYYGLAWGVSHL